MTGIARSITPGQGLRSIFPITNQTKDAQVQKLIILMDLIKLLKLNFSTLD